MAKEFLPLFLDFNETTQDLTDDQCGRLVRALVDYANGNEYHLDGMELLAFRFLKGSIDRNERLSAIRAEAGSKGGKQSQANASKNKQTEASESKTEQKHINNDNDNKNKNDNDNKFDRFWLAYPRHVAKQTARKEFQKLNPDDELLTVMIRAIEQQKQSDQWTKDGGQYIPHPSTWIHQRRWEDEMKPVAVIRPVISQQYEQRDYSSVQDEILSEQQREIEEKLRRKAAGI
jgi:hypothetical protein